MHESKRKLLVRWLVNCWRSVIKHSAVLVTRLAVITLVLVFIGTLTAHFAKVRKSVASQSTFESGVIIFDWLTDSLYEAAQAVSLNMESNPNGAEATGDTDNSQSNGPATWPSLIVTISIAMARVTAVALVVLIAGNVIGTLFKKSETSLRLSRLGKRHMFIAGLGRIGFRLAIEYSRNQKHVVVQEISERNCWTKLAEDADVLVLQEDVSDMNRLEEHICRDPEFIHLVTGDDHINVNALANIRLLRSKSRSRLNPVTCYVHLDDPSLLKTLTRYHIEMASRLEPELTVRLFNIFHETACQLVIDQLTPLRPKKSHEVALYIVFGAGKMGQAMVAELAEYAHFENQKRARILVLTRNPKSACDNYLAHWGKLSPRFVHEDLRDVVFNEKCDEWSCRDQRPDKAYQVDDIKAVEYAANVHFCKLSSLKAISLADVDALYKLATAPNVRPIVLFCFDEDKQNFRLGSELNALLQDFYGINRKLQTLNPPPQDQHAFDFRNPKSQLPIFIFLPHSLPLREVINQAREWSNPNNTNQTAVKHDSGPKHIPNIAFGAVSEGLKRAHDHVIEEIAIDIAYSYDKREFEKAQSTLPSSDPATTTNDLPPKAEFIPRHKYPEQYHTKPYWEQHSNLTAAEHALIKLQMLGYRMVPPNSNEMGDLPLNFAFESIPIGMRTRLAVVEHNRWMAERLLLGWSFGAKSNQPPRRDSLCDWQHVKHKDVEKDLEQIKAILKAFKDRGYKMIRSDDAPDSATADSEQSAI